MKSDRMKLIKLTVLALLFTGASQNLTAQENTGFTPYGKPVFLVFSNVHATLDQGGINPAFELTRVYLGYEYFFSKSLSSRVNIDMGDPGIGGLQMTAYIKNAYLQYKADKFSTRFGMIGTDQYNLIEKNWGYRYIFKTLQDEYAFGPSADLGAAIEYSPSKIISFDASVLNGEGYKKLQSDSALKYTAGITLKPTESLTLRAYTDYMKKDYAQNTYSFFAGYAVKAFRIGAEYDIQKNNRMIYRHDISGISAWASAALSKKISAFIRYDKLWSDKPAGENDPWNLEKDGQLFLAGFDYSPVKGIKIAPVYTGWNPSGAGKKLTSSAGLYFEIKL